MPPRRLRLDAELVRRGLARSREHASELIAAGRVTVDRTVARKPATGVTTAADLVVRSDSAEPDYASRGGHKLAGALRDFGALGLRVDGRRVLDAGASTGGFTDVLLRAGAAQVVAVDVGYGQLVWRLRSDARVVVLDRTNVRDLDLEVLGRPVDLVVGDLSFISLRLVLPALSAVTDPGGDLALMVKPQFEVGKDRLGRGGVVRDAGLRAAAVEGVLAASEALGWHGSQVTPSSLPGPAGNREYFVWLRRDADGIPADVLRAAVEEGPETAAPGERVGR